MADVTTPASPERPRVAIVSRDTSPDFGSSRFRSVAQALAARGLQPVLCRYDEARETEAERVLGRCAAALVWVNPEHDGRFRTGLDALLRRVAAKGVLVSAHPDIIDRLGVKAVLAATRELGWSGDSWFYPTPEALRRGLPSRLAGGPRVLKQNRGQSGLGVWRVELLDGGRVRVVAATDRRQAHEQPLEDFLAARCLEIERVGGFVDQAFQPRLSDGMIRCYMSGRRLAGFGWQKVRALLDPDTEATPPRTYSGADDPRFQVLRRRMEDVWTPALLRVLRLGADELPILWDADFLFGPRDAAGQDSFVLCEINVSSVAPMPDEAPAVIARTLSERLTARRLSSPDF